MLQGVHCRDARRGACRARCAQIHSLMLRYIGKKQGVRDHPDITMATASAADPKNVSVAILAQTLDAQTRCKHIAHKPFKSHEIEGHEIHEGNEGDEANEGCPWQIRRIVQRSGRGGWFATQTGRNSCGRDDGTCRKAAERYWLVQACWRIHHEADEEACTASNERVPPNYEGALCFQGEARVSDVACKANEEIHADGDR